MRRGWTRRGDQETHLGDHADNEALFLDIVRCDRVGVLEDFSCSAGSAAAGARE